jgi:hypothetical protein
MLHVTTPRVPGSSSRYTLLRLQARFYAPASYLRLFVCGLQVRLFQYQPGRRSEHQLVCTLFDRARPTFKHAVSRTIHYRIDIYAPVRGLLDVLCLSMRNAYLSI